MPFGLLNAPSTFQRIMDFMLAGLKWSSCLVYLDDIVVFAPTFEEHIRRLRSVLYRVRESGLRLKLSKYRFLASQLPILWYVVSSAGIQSDPENRSRSRIPYSNLRQRGSELRRTLLLLSKVHP